MLCETCGKRDTCTKLCDEAEAYVDQDYVPLREKYFNGIEPTTWPKRKVKDPPRTRAESRKLKILIIQMYRDGKTATEISRLLPISQSYASRIILRTKINN